MTRLRHIPGFVVFALSFALIAACLALPALLAPTYPPAGTSTISHGTLAIGIAHALRADGPGMLQRTLAVIALACALAFGMVRGTTTLVPAVPAAAPGSFERPLRI